MDLQQLKKFIYNPFARGIKYKHMHYYKYQFLFRLYLYEYIINKLLIIFIY
jgi:hypothetical protein